MTVDDPVNDPGVPEELQQRRNRVLEADLAHFRRLAAANVGDPAYARETALWEALAVEVEKYLRPSSVGDPSLFDEEGA